MANNRKINIKKINTADFSKVNRDDMTRIARSLNPFFDEVDNKLQTIINHEYQEISIEVDALGIPKTSPKFTHSLTTSIRGMMVVNVDNSDLLSAPYICYKLEGSIVTITKVLGLKPNIKYKITIVCLG